MANSFQNKQESPELVKIAELAENVIYRLPGCADVVVRKVIQEVYREFCRETKCLTEDRFLEIDDNRAEYPVSAMYHGVVGEVREVVIEHIRLMRDRDYRVVTGRETVVVLADRYVCFPHNECPEGAHPARHRIHVAEALMHRGMRRMRIRATEYPKMNSEIAPAWFIAKHGDAIVSGVLSRICAMSGRPWANQQIAGDERIRYENAKSEARMFEEVPQGGRFIDTSMVL